MGMKSERGHFRAKIAPGPGRNDFVMGNTLRGSPGVYAFRYVGVHFRSAVEGSPSGGVQGAESLRGHFIL